MPTRHTVDPTLGRLLLVLTPIALAVITLALAVQP